MWCVVVGWHCQSATVLASAVLLLLLSMHNLLLDALVMFWYVEIS
jgi:hypothetical protein